MNYIEAQINSDFHIKARRVLFLTVLLSALIPVIGYWVLLGFFLYTSFPLLKQMFMWMAIFFVLTALFPPLGVLIWIVVIIFLIMRINFIKNNWIAIKKGIIFYGLLSVLVTILPIGYFLWEFINGFSILVALGLGFFAAKRFCIYFDKEMEELYSLGYDTKNALGIMGSSPLLLITLLLPFIKMAIPADFVIMETDVTVGNTEPIVPNSVQSTQASAVETVPVQSTNTEINPLKMIKLNETVDSDGKSKVHIKANGKGIVKGGVKIAEAIVNNHVTNENMSQGNFASNNSTVQFSKLDIATQQTVINTTSEAVTSQDSIDRLVEDAKQKNDYEYS